MATHRRPGQPGRTRVTLLTTAAAAAVALSTHTADAAPGAGQGKDEVRSKVDALQEDAERETEKYNAALEKQEKLRSEVSRIQDTVARGQEALNVLRRDVGGIATAQYRSGGMDPSLQLLLSSEPEEYLEKASTLGQLSDHQAQALKKIQEAQRGLAQERAEAARKLEELAATRAELGKKKKGVQSRLAAAEKLLNTLTAQERAALDAAEQRANRSASERVSLGDAPPASARGAAAFAAARSKIGSSYVWGATGPSSFDCSGLTAWAYRQAGVSIPRTSQAQAGAGTRIASAGDLRVGDLVFFFSDLHHVGIYAGNGQIVHAPRTGTFVRYESMSTIGGPFMFGVRI
jgi:cell wall-associated NlpC family hydrolase